MGTHSLGRGALVILELWRTWWASTGFRSGGTGEQKELDAADNDEDNVDGGRFAR